MHTPSESLGTTDDLFFIIGCTAWRLCEGPYYTGFCGIGYIGHHWFSPLFTYNNRLSSIESFIFHYTMRVCKYIVDISNGLMLTFYGRVLVRDYALHTDIYQLRSKGDNELGSIRLSVCPSVCL